MLRSVNELKGYSIHAVDGDIGRMEEFYFDDNNWAVRYLVAETGTWLSGRKTLLSPVSLKEPDWAQHIFPVSLTRDQIKNSPGVDTHKPISRMHQWKLHAYYGWPVYWATGGFSGYVEPLFPTFVNEEIQRTPDGEPVDKDCEDCHLQSTKDVEGYRVHAVDGELGIVEDFIVDDESWNIRYIIINIKNPGPAKKVLVPPQWIREVRWSQKELIVDHTREEIRKSPIYDPASPVNRKYEKILYDYFGRPKYWEPK